MASSNFYDLRSDHSLAGQLSSNGSRPLPYIPPTPAFNWRPYSIHLPCKYKVEHGDVLIIYEEVHSKSASEMKDEINGMLINQHIQAKALLYDEAASHVSNRFTWLDEALKTHTDVFAIGTFNTSQGVSTTDPILDHHVQATLTASLIDRYSKKDCFTLILTSEDQRNHLPTYLSSLKPICMYIPTWKENVRKRLEFRINLRLARESEQSDRCLQYLEERGRLTPSSASSRDSGYSHSSLQGVSTYSSHGSLGVGAGDEIVDSSIDGVTCEKMKNMQI